jgi:hypothetical protein
LEKQGRRLSFPPRFGQHNKDIYGSLGYAEEDLRKLQDAKVI